jgi:hypothetical protein
MTPAQCRGARGLLGWSQTTLGKNSGVHINSVCNFETGKHCDGPSKDLMRNALMEAGIVFIEDFGIILARWKK